jgi:hypothetical protein
VVVELSASCILFCGLDRARPVLSPLAGVGSIACACCVLFVQHHMAMLLSHSLFSVLRRLVGGCAVRDVFYYA